MMKQRIALFIRWITRKKLSEDKRQEISRRTEEYKAEQRKVWQRARAMALISSLPENWTVRELLPWYEEDTKDSFDGTLAFFVSPCIGCIHRKRSPEGICEAYPNGIPLEIWLGLHDHTESYPGDNGIRFQSKRS